MVRFALSLAVNSFIDGRLIGNNRAACASASLSTRRRCPRAAQLPESYLTWRLSSDDPRPAGELGPCPMRTRMNKPRPMLCVPPRFRE